jgi:transposase InsO family protein
VPQVDADKRQEIALFRYQVIAPLVTQNLNRVQYGLLLQEVVRQEYSVGERSDIRIGRRTVQRWVQDYRREGLPGLEPAVRSDKHVRRVVAPAILDQAIALRREVPGRSVEQVIAILEMSGKVEKGVLKRTTLNEHLVRAGCSRAAVIQAAKRRPTLRRWEAPNRNAVWQGDAKSGYFLPNPAQPSRRRQVHLLAWIDDYSRLVYGQFYWEEQLPRLEDCLKRTILRYGIPQRIYVDNGAIYSSRHLQRICARLCIRLTHSRPYRPMGRGKIERFFRHVDQSFGPEVQLLIQEGKITTLAELNEFFWAWLDVGYNRRRHGSTGQAPLDRWNQDAAEVRRIDAIALREAFLWEEQRVVDKTGCIALHGNSYEVEHALAGRKVTLRYDPFDLSQLQVWLDGQRYPDPTPVNLRRQRRREAERLTATPAPATGLNYLALAKKQHEEHVRQELGQTHFSRLMGKEGNSDAR